MNEKRNIFCATVALLVAGLCAGSGSGWAADDGSLVKQTSAQMRLDPSVVSTIPKNHETYSDANQAIDGLLKHIRNRERDQAFALLSSTAQARFGGDARVFMNNVRLYHHALYDHAGYRLIDPGARPASTAEPMAATVIKIQLIDGEGREDLILVRASPDIHGIWQIDGMTSIGNAKARDA